jgi:hypothetical protein
MPGWCPEGIVLFAVSVRSTAGVDSAVDGNRTLMNLRSIADNPEERPTVATLWT